MSDLKIIFVAGENMLTLLVERQKHIGKVEAKLLERLSEKEREQLTDVTFRKYWLDEDEDRVEIMSDDDYNSFLRHAEVGSIPTMFFEVPDDGLASISPIHDLISNMGRVRINGEHKKHNFTHIPLVGRKFMAVRNGKLACIFPVHGLRNNMAVMRGGDRYLGGQNIQHQKGFAVRGGVVVKGLDFGFHFAYDYTD